MISGIYPFDGENLFVLLENISKGEYVLPAEAEDPIFQSLLTGKSAALMQRKCS